MIKSILTASVFVTSCIYSLHVQAEPILEKVEAKYIISSYAKTKYPLVFTPGMGAFTRIGTDALGMDYWYQITPDLARNGANVWPVRVSPFNTHEVRGEQLLKQVEEILAITGSQKVNLLGHSHGGPTVRYVAGIIPNKVASITSISVPNKGSPIADFLLKAEGTPVEKPLVAAVNLVSQSIVWAQGLDPTIFPHDALGSAHSLSTDGSLTFNAKFPMGIPLSSCGEGAYQEKGIQLYSLSGTSTVNNILDPTDAAMLATSLLINNGRDNDGLVARCSAKFGKTIRDDFKWNHFDPANMVLGLRGIFSQDPVDVYRQHANRLKLQGL